MNEDQERPDPISELCLQVEQLSGLIAAGTMIASKQVQEARRPSLERLAAALEELMGAFTEYNAAINRERELKPS